MAGKSKSKALYTAGPQSLHKIRRVLGLPIIAHTGRVNSYARCLGGKLKGATSVADAKTIMASSVTACNGVPGGKKKTWIRKDGRRVTAK